MENNNDDRSLRFKESFVIIAIIYAVYMIMFSENNKKN